MKRVVWYFKDGCFVVFYITHMRTVFFTLPEYEAWKAVTPNFRNFEIKYYKGLGTSTRDEARDYFSDLPKHKITFVWYEILHHPLQSTIPPSSKYHTTLFKIPYHPLQSTIPPSLKYHTTLFKVTQYNHLQITTSPSSKYRSTLFKVPHNPFQSTTQPYSSTT